MIPIGRLQTLSSLAPCYDFVKKSIAVTVIKCAEIRRDAEAFQKTCLIALSMIHVINFHCKTHYFPSFVRVLDHAPAFDFYGFFRRPRMFLFPYTAERIDEWDLLDQLESILCNNWRLGTLDGHRRLRDYSVYVFAKRELSALLVKMASEDLDFRTGQDVKDFILTWLKNTLNACPIDQFNGNQINLHHLKIKLKKISFVEKIGNIAFVAVDIACIPDFLQIWGIIDLSSYSELIGNCSLASGLPLNQSLGDLIWGGLLLGHGLIAFNAGRYFWKGELTSEESKTLKWVMAASLAESIFSLSNLLKKEAHIINCLALIAKSLGLVAFLVVGQPTFFQDPFSV